jgi:UDP-GlcNAc:undecaprenyl-phosphate GlcNAc-1-phosphate transferase
VYSDQYIFIIYSAFFLTVVCFSLFINAIFLKFATTLGIREQEGAVIRWSTVSKPALGGISFYIAFLFSAACFAIFFEDAHLFQDKSALALLGTTVLAFLMGLADDAYDTKPMLKFGVQFVCGAILIFSENYIRLFDFELLNYLITIFWVVGIMNSINMLDNMDGVTTSVSISILLICIIAAGFQNGLVTFEFMSMVGIVAALVGFLFFNWHPSKMFMGDTGSQFLGMFLAFVSIKYLWNGTLYNGETNAAQQICQALVAFIVPVIDTTTVFINRMYRGQSPFVGGRDHTTHHLSYLGLSDSQVGFVLIGINVVSIVMSIAIFKFIDAWLWYHTLTFVTYFLLVFVTLFTITQKNKERRI